VGKVVRLLKGKTDNVYLKVTMAGNVHHAQPAAVSLTQETECGTLYGADQIAAISEVARRHGLRLHMDGARFANAVAALACHPADITWRAGVDALSFCCSWCFFFPSRALRFTSLSCTRAHFCSQSSIWSLAFRSTMSASLPM